jgi:crotonobetainyl-CoA:carnitine CoA-transferase CaiB-like acyl-CoA transferase
VICRLSGYGQSSPIGGHDLNFVASSGVLGMMKKSERKSPLPVQWADLAGGSWPAALQIVAALYERDCQIKAPLNKGHEVEESSRSRLLDINLTVTF